MTLRLVHISGTGSNVTHDSMIICSVYNYCVLSKQQKSLKRALYVLICIGNLWASSYSIKHNPLNLLLLVLDCKTVTRKKRKKSRPEHLYNATECTAMLCALVSVFYNILKDENARALIKPLIQLLPWELLIGVYRQGYR